MIFRTTTSLLLIAVASTAYSAESNFPVTRQGNVSAAGNTGNQIAPSTRQPTPQCVISHCQVFLIKDVELSANEAGAIVAMYVHEGDPVQPGQLLAKIDDRQAQFDRLAAELKRDAALAKSQDDIEIRYSEAALGVADAELSQNTEINRHSPGTVSTTELRRLKLTRKKAQLQIDRSRLEQKISRMTADVETTAVAAAEENMRRRQITAPFAGIVLDVLRDQAEWVNAGEPVLRVIRLDRLRVEGFLNARNFNPEDVVNRQVTVQIQRARGQVVQLPGKVVFVSPLVQAGDKYRIRAEVENRIYDDHAVGKQAAGTHWVLGPGMVATMVIHVGG